MIPDFFQAIKFPLIASFFSALLGYATSFYLGHIVTLVENFIITSSVMCLVYIVAIYKIDSEIFRNVQAILLRKSDG